VLDEPTASLDEKEVAELFKVMRRLRADGLGIVFVTHFLDQVYAVSDRMTVLRNGQLVGEYATAELPRLALVGKMLGREVNDATGRSDGAAGAAPIRRGADHRRRLLARRARPATRGRGAPIDLTLGAGR
jgi:monosaccharide-transporting ATPase